MHTLNIYTIANRHTLITTNKNRRSQTRSFTLSHAYFKPDISPGIHPEDFGVSRGIAIPPRRLLPKPFPEQTDHAVFDSHGAQEEIGFRHDFDQVHDNAELRELLRVFDVDSSSDGEIVRIDFISF